MREATEAQHSTVLAAVRALSVSGLARQACQLMRYGMASGSALAADLVVYMSLVTFGLVPAVAGLFAFSVGVLVHYIIGTRFVFDTSRVNRPRAQLFAEYATAGIVGSIVTTSVIALMTSSMFGLAPLPAKLVAVGINFFAVFAILRVVVFRPDDHLKS